MACNLLDLFAAVDPKASAWLQVAFEWHPWREQWTFWNVSCAIYLLIFSAYWLYNLVHLFIDMKAAAYIRYFTTHKLGLSERQLQTVTWPDIVSRIVQVLLHKSAPASCP